MPTVTPKMKVVLFVICFTLFCALTTTHVPRDGDQRMPHTDQQQQTQTGHHKYCINHVSAKCLLQVSLDSPDLDTSVTRIRARHGPYGPARDQRLIKECCNLLNVGQCIKQEVENICKNISNSERNLISKMLFQSFNTKCTQSNASKLTCFILMLSRSKILVISVIICFMVCSVIIATISAMVIIVCQAPINPGEQEME